MGGYTIDQSVIADAMEWALMLLPMALYLLVLGVGVNRSRRPVVMSGAVSLLGLLFAVSGLFLLGPPSWVAHLFRPWSNGAYWTAYGVYLAVLLLVAVWLLRRQRHVTVVYNLDPPAFAETLRQVLDELDEPYTATPGRVALANGRVVLDIEASYAWNNITLRWHGDPHPLRDELQQRLTQALRKVEPEYNLGGILLILCAVFLFVFILFVTAAFVLTYPAA